MSFYRLKQFQCEVTGKSGLDYFQALESEQQEARTMHTRFPEPLKSAILRAVQWRTFLPGVLLRLTCRSLPNILPPSAEVMGRLDHLVEAVYERFKDRYFRDESVSFPLNERRVLNADVCVLLQKYILIFKETSEPCPPFFCVLPTQMNNRDTRFFARVLEVFPPRPNAVSFLVNSDSHEGPIASTSSQPPKKSPTGLVHQIYGDLKIAATVVNAADDPAKYYYRVQILEEEKLEGRDKHGASAKEARARYSGSFLDVQCSQMR